jgi:hypothetical protein
MANAKNSTCHPPRSDLALLLRSEKSCRENKKSRHLNEEEEDGKTPSSAQNSFIDILAFLVFLRRLSQTKTVPVPVYMIVSVFLVMRYKNRDGDGFFRLLDLPRQSIGRASASRQRG